MTEVSAANDLDLFGRVLTVWVRAAAESARPQGGLLPLLNAFTSPAVERIAPTVRGLRGGRLDLAEIGAWLVGAPVDLGEPVLFPVASVGLERDSDKITASIRVALLYEQLGNPYATGYRYESAESPTGPHHFPHVQVISGWHLRQPCLLHPHGRDENIDRCLRQRLAWQGQPVDDDEVDVVTRVTVLNEQRPAFPLRSNTLPGFAVAFLASLYGGHRARELILTDRTLASPLQAYARDFADVLGNVT